MPIANEIVNALGMSFSMLWEILWPLCLGFLISGAIQAVVSNRKVAALLPDASAKSIIRASAFGAASSSCSYAAVAITRTLFRKGANFTSAMAFEFASTNLVFDLSLLVVILLGWQFMVGEFAGGILMIVVLSILFRIFLKPRQITEARQEAEKGVQGIMEGHAAMDMSVKSDGSLFKRMFSNKGITAISHYYVMDWMSVWKDIAIGLLLAGMLAAWVPDTFWLKFFYSGHGFGSTVWGALIAPVVGMLSFVCSVGNVPLAAVLWNGGISFAGVITFLFADLLVLPILNIYRKYYGWKMMLFIFATSYAAIVIAGLGIDLLFSALGIVPKMHAVAMTTETIKWNYTSFLNIVFIIATVLLTIRFFRTDGKHMLKMMNSDEKSKMHTHHEHEHHEHSHSAHDHNHEAHNHEHHNHGNHNHGEHSMHMH